MQHPILFWGYVAGVALLLGIPLVFDRGFFRELADYGPQRIVRFAALVLFWPIGLPTLFLVIVFWELTE